MNELPTGWVWAELSQVCISITDGDHQAPPQVPAGIPFLVIGNIRTHELDFTGCRHVPPEYFESLASVRRPQKGDILYSLVGSYGISVLVKDDVPFCVQRHIGILRPSKEISSSFLALLMSSQAIFNQATKYATGTAQMTVPLSGLRRIRLPIPPRREQERIVAVIEEQFSRLDAGVAAIKRTQRNIKRLRAALLETAVAGKLTALWRSQHQDVEPAEILIKRLSDQRRQVFHGASKKSNGSSTIQLPALPKTWSYTRIEPLLSLDRPGMKTGPFGSLLKKHEHRLEGVPVLGIENVEPMRFVPGSKIHISHEKAEELSTYDVRPGDVLISRSGTVGEVCVAPQDLKEARFSTNLMRVVLNADGMLPGFFALLVNGSSTVLAQISDLCKGTTRAFLNQEILSSIAFPIPPLAEQQEILSQLDERLSWVTSIERQVASTLRMLPALRQSILSDAFSGKLVPQDSDDEPASVLLERIAAEQESSSISKPTRTRKHQTFGEKTTA